MKTPMTFGKLWEQIKKLFWVWLLIAVVAGVAVLAVNYLRLPTKERRSRL